MTMHIPDPRSAARVLGGEVIKDNEILCPGPGHGPKDRSLQVGFGRHGDIVVRSYSGDDPIQCKDYVRRKLGLPEWKPAKLDSGGMNGSAVRSKIVATYDYCDADGQLIYQVVRKEPKDFLQRRPDPNKPGEWIWDLKGITRLPYRLPELLAEIDDRVFIVEGEKDVDALLKRRFSASCNSGGAGKWTPELNQYFTGRSVFILPDQDDAGSNHALHVAGNLMGIAREVRIVNLPNLPEKGDVSDWFDAGGETRQLIDIALATPVWEPERKDSRKDSPRIGSAAELRRKTFPDLRYIVPNILAEGCTLLAGRPKLGKSWLMLDVSLAVAAGRFCLGDTKCEQGEVLYLGLEDNERRLQRRITKILGAFGTEWPKDFHYSTEWPRANEGGSRP